MRPVCLIFYTSLIFLLLGIEEISFAQVSTSHNYVMSNTVKQSGVTTETSVNGLTISTQGKAQTITYLDGLGRPIQNVLTNGSASQKDIVTGMEYDVYEREVKKYLPYADQTSSTYGSYKDNWNSSQANFYNGVLPNVDADIAPFSITMSESSPLNRTLAQGNPGSTWQPNPTNAYDPYSHVTQFQYLFNKATDSV